MPIYLCFPRSCYCCGCLLQIHSDKEGTGFARQTDRGGFNARLIQHAAVLHGHCGGCEFMAVRRRGLPLHQTASGYIRLLGLPYCSSCFLVEFLPIYHFFLNESGSMKTSAIVELSSVSCFRVSMVHLVCNYCDLPIEWLLCHYRVSFVSATSFHSQPV